MKSSYIPSLISSRTRVRIRPRRFSPLHFEGGVFLAISSLRPMPQIRSCGEVSTRVPVVESSAFLIVSFWQNLATLLRYTISTRCFFHSFSEKPRTFCPKDFIFLGLVVVKICSAICMSLKTLFSAAELDPV